MLKLIGLCTVSIAALYGLEYAGVVPQGKYLSFLPRQEQPGLHMPEASINMSFDFNSQKPSENQSETQRPHAETTGKPHTFTDRVSARASSPTLIKSGSY